MSKRRPKVDDFDLDLDSEALTRQLNELLASTEAETEAVFASLPQPEPETLEVMHARHAAEGRLVQRKVLEFFSRRRCA